MSPVLTYLDHAATTPLRPEAIAVLADTGGLHAANASGSHRVARRARAAVDDARERLADLLAVEPGDVVFTSGGTESDNLAILGRRAAVAGELWCSAIEHPAVLEAVDAATSLVIPVTSAGIIDLDAFDQLAVAAADAGRTVSVVSVMTVNNEVGTIQPVEAVAEVVRRRLAGAAMHTDAVQALNWVDLRAIGPYVDLLSLSGHKFGGPQGVGAIVIRKGTKLAARQIGGGQEREWRSGTLNVAGIVAMVAAAEAADRDRRAETLRLAALRDRLVDGVLGGVPDALWTGSLTPVEQLAAGVAHFCFDGVEAEALLFLIDADGVCASAASACASGAQRASHVLDAMGLTQDGARGSLRLTLGHTTTESDIEHAVTSIVSAVHRLRTHAH